MTHKFNYNKYLFYLFIYINYINIMSDSRELERKKLFENNLRFFKGSLAETSQVQTHHVEERPPSVIPKLDFLDLYTNDALIEYNVKKNKKVCILNFANADVVGGGVTNGKIAQEEDLMLTSPMLYYSIATRLAKRDTRNGIDIFTYTNWGHRNWYKYIIVSKKVKFNRNSQLQLVSEYTGSVITAAAPNHKHSDISTALADKNKIKQVIRNILEAAFNLGCNVLILGAWGCGAFAPSDRSTYRSMIADAFGEVIATSPYTFETICFPIRDTEMRNIFQTRIMSIIRNLSEISNPSIQSSSPRQLYSPIQSSSPRQSPSPRRTVHCRVQGCTDEHTKHYCKHCGNKDSDHFSRHCSKKKFKIINSFSQSIPTYRISSPSPRQQTTSVSQATISPRPIKYVPPVMTYQRATTSVSPVKISTIPTTSVSQATISPRQQTKSVSQATISPRPIKYVPPVTTPPAPPTYVPPVMTYQRATTSVSPATISPRPIKYVPPVTTPPRQKTTYVPPAMTSPR